MARIEEINLTQAHKKHPFYEPSPLTLECFWTKKCVLFNPLPPVENEQLEAC
jgi:hypothetical protein